MKILRYILLPIVPIYFLISWFRNKLFDLGIFASTSYDLPIICVGNLSVGGTGKTPMTEYLVRLLRQTKRVAILSRGYKRESQGFIIADKHATVRSIGDEPFQFYSKFDDIIVSVDANRRNGISKLLTLDKRPEVILLDDAYQHRKVKAGLYILLTAYDDLYSDDIVLPTGNLREPRIGAKRADVIIITKCPMDLQENEKIELRSKLNVLPSQKLFFSTIAYSETIYSSKESQPISNLQNIKFTLVTGIANAKPLIDHLKHRGLEFEHLNFKDHHNFSGDELGSLKEKELILTTEKDFMRLRDDLEHRNLYYLPIETQFTNAGDLDKLIKNFVVRN